jgi:hypothetical protein
MRRAAYASAAMAILIGCALGCGREKPPPPPREPPARVLSVVLDRLSLQANAYVELHAWLAAAARDAVPPPPGLDAAVDAYRRALANDDDDALLAATTAALSACTDDRCARAAVEPTPFRRAWSSSFDTFASRWWTERADLARAGVEIAREAFSVESEAVLARITHDLEIEWPDRPLVVDVVVESPPAGNRAFIGAALPVHGPCFVREGGESVRHARIIDCVLVRALYPLREKSRIGKTLDERAWQLKVINVVAATLRAWEPRHVSPSLRSSAAVREPSLQ